MSKIANVSRWSIVIRKTNKGYQARVFIADGERPVFHHKQNLRDLLAFVETEVVPKLGDMLVPLKPKAA